VSEFGAVLHEMLHDTDVASVARDWASSELASGLGLWRRLAELGVTALAVPEKRGGLGASPMDLVVVCEELGHHAVPGPVAESLAAVPVLLAGLDGVAAAGGGRPRGTGVCGEWLAGLADGELIATLAVPPVVPLAACTEVAGLVLLAADGVVSAGRAGERYRSVDPARSLAEVRSDRVVAEAATEAVVAEGAGAGTAARDVSAAKVACADAAYRAARTALQVHGAIGYTAEHELSRWLVQVRALVPAWGSLAEHRARVLRELG
jgi:alkylation response protein AidB-like acyl-CoA dehydrogenase